MTETARRADYVLPASSQYEKAEATFFNLTFPDNAFHLRKPILDPLPGTLPEPEIYRRLCVALGAMPDRFPILERVAKVDRQARRLRTFPVALKARLALEPKLAPLASLVLYATLGKALPEGLESAAVLWTGALMMADKHTDAVRRAGIEDTGAGLGEALFKAILESDSGTTMTHHRYEETWSFLRHADGKVHLTIPELLPELKALSEPLEPGGGFVLMAGERRSYNANTILRAPQWRKSDPDGALRMNPGDAERLGVDDGDRVRVVTNRGEVEATVERFDGMQRGVVSLPHGYGMAHPGEDGERVQHGPWINRLTDASHCDPHTKTPLHKAVSVDVVPV
ncbi:MAG: molybdopterin dinucleotide binding domain-containing protein, partial [Myxococcota bacterium]